MEASKRKKGSKFREKIYFNGKETKSPWFDRKADAKAWKMMKLVEKDKAKLYGHTSLGETKQVSFKQFAKEWLGGKKKSQRTHNNYESVIRVHLEPYLEGMSIQSIQREDAQKIIQSLIDRNLKPKTISCIFGVLKSIFTHAKKLKVILNNPTEFVEIPKIPKKVPLYLSKEEINLFLRSNRSNELYPLYVVALNTGCRRGELAALQWHQVIFDTNLIEVSATRDKLGRKDTTKNGKNRFVPMNEITRMTLLALSQNRVSDYVFTHSDGEPLRVNHLYRYFRKAIEKAGIEKDITFHKLRDTFASQFMMSGGNIYELQKILGHSSTDMTQIYAHLSPSHLASTTKIISFGDSEVFSDEFRPNIGPEIKQESNLINMQSVSV